MEQVKRGCHVCQVSEHPNWANKGKYIMTPIPEAPFLSVCLDVFAMPCVEWQGHTYDCAIICVDRHSGWIIAKPAQYVGLTAEKVAHALLDGSWDYFGIPATITSDQGPRFIGAWFQTMCGR